MRTDKTKLSPMKKAGIYGRKYNSKACDYSYKLLDGDSVIIKLESGELIEVNLEDYAMNVRAMRSTLVVLPRSGNSVDIRTEAAYKER